MSKKILTAGIIGIALASAIAAPAHAVDACTVNNGATNITGNTMCILNENVAEINITSTISELGNVLHAFANDPSYNYTTHAASATINATITDIFSTDNITWLSTIAPTGATVVITPTIADIVYTQVPYTMPTGFTLNYPNNSIIHLPEGTTPADAASTFVTIGNPTITVAINGTSGKLQNITEEDGVIILHLTTSSTIAEAIAISSTITTPANFAIASGNTYVIAITPQRHHHLHHRPKPNHHPRSRPPHARRRRHQRHRNTIRQRRLHHHPNPRSITHN